MHNSISFKPVSVFLFPYLELQSLLVQLGFCLIYFVFKVINHENFLLSTSSRGTYVFSSTTTRMEAYSMQFWRRREKKTQRVMMPSLMFCP